MSSQPHNRGSEESFGKSHKKQSKGIWKTITILKISTGDLVFQFDDPPVSSDGCCPEDLNHSKSFGGAEGIAAPILDLGKDPAKHDLARVTVLVVGAVLGLGGHNGGSSFGGGGPWNHSTEHVILAELKACEKVHMYYSYEHTKKRPLIRGLTFHKSKGDSRVDLFWGSA